MPGKEGLVRIGSLDRPVVDYEQNLDTNLLGQPQWPLLKTILAVLGLSLVAFMVCTAETIYNQCLLYLRSELHTEIFSQWINASFLLTCTILQPVWIVLTERFSRTWLLLTSTLIFMLFSGMIAVSQSMLALCVGRALQGVGGAGMMPLASVVLTDILTPNQRGFYMGLFGAVIILGKWAGPAIGAAFLEKAHWRWAEFVNLPVGVVALSVLYYTLRDLPNPPGQTIRSLREFDYLGSLFWLGGSISILLALIWGGNEHPWGSVFIVCPYVVGFVGILAFFIVEGKYTRWPIIPLHLLARPRTLLTLLVSFLIGLCMYGIITFVPAYYSMLDVEGPLSSALHILWCALGGCIGAILAGHLVSIRGRVYYREWAVLGTALLSVGYILLYTWPRSPTAKAKRAGFQVVAGLGLGFSMEQVRLASQAGLLASEISTVTTLIDYARTLGGMIGLAVGGVVMREKVFSSLRESFPALLSSSSLNSMDVVRVESLAPLLHYVPPALSEPLYKGLVGDFHVLFVVDVPVAALACILCFFIANTPLDVITSCASSAEDDNDAVAD